MSSKKIYIFLMVFTIFISSTIVQAETYDYTPGLLFGKPFFDQTNKKIYEITDGNNSTRASIVTTGQHVRYDADLAESMTIKQMYIYKSGAQSGAVEFYDSTGKMIHSIYPMPANGYRNLNLNDVKRVRITSRDGNYKHIHSFELYGEIVKEVPPDVPTGLRGTVTDSTITLTWNKEDDELRYNVYLNGIKVNSSPISGNNYTIQNLDDETNYSVQISAVNNRNLESDLSEPLQIQTKKYIVPEVSSLQAKNSSSSIRLLWENPDFEKFSHVNIYRKGLKDGNTSLIEEFFLGKIVFANEDYVKMFSTNGTWWEDHTIVKDSSYEYLVKVEDENGKESNGVTIRATAQTPPPQPPKNIDIGHGEDENGKYLLIEWDAVEGAVHYEIIIDGAVPIIVHHPTTSYKHYHDGTKDTFDVQIIVVGEDGQKSPPKRPPVFKDVEFDITVGDLIKNTLDYIMLFKEFVLLGIVIILAPMIIRFFKRVIRKRQARGVRL